MINPQEIKYKSPEYDEMLALRYEVLRKPLGLTFSEEAIANEKDDIFLVLRMPRTHEMVACCILTPVSNNVVQLRQMAVSPARQKLGFGKTMLGVAEYIAATKGFDTIMLHARKVAVDFYKKHGYIIEGNEFMEVGIPHFEMIKRI